MPAILARLGRDGLAGAFVLALGVALYFLVRDYPRGSLSEFGPGFVPWAASFGLMLLGAAMVVRGWREPGEAARIAVSRPLVFLPLAIAVFAFGIETAGMFVTAAASVFVASLASRELSLAERAAASLALAALVVLVFGYGLSMTVPLWPFTR